MIPAIDSINVIFLSVFIEIRIILHCVSRIDLGIVDVKIRVFFSALHQRHHCTLTSEELRNLKGILIRDYNQKIRETRQKKEQIVQLLNRVIRMESFQDDFYRKPLEQMLELVDDAQRVLMQLKTTVQSFDSLMEKLEVDISVVEREKERIVELM